MTPKKRNGDITYKLTPEELKYFSWVSMSPELRRQNRNNRVKAYLSSAPSIGNFWEALLTYIGNRDPENPHLNTGEAPNASRAINPKLVAQTVLTAGKIIDKAKRYITLTKESTKMLNYPRIGQRYSKSLDIMSDFNPISDLLHLRLPDFTHSSLGLGNKYRAIGGRKALKSVIENGVVAPKGLFSREGKVFWNDGYLDRTYSRRGIFALSYDKTGKAHFYDGGRANSNYVYSSHENPIDFYDEALGLHARIPFTSTYVEIPKTLAGIDRALKLDKINRYVEKPVHKLYNWGLKPYLGYLGFKYFNSKEEEINKKEELEKLKKQQYLDDYYSYYYKDGGLIRKMLTAAGGALLTSRLDMKYQTAAANKLGEWFLKGLGTIGKIVTAPFTSQGPTSATIYKSKELLAKERTIENKSEELLGKAMTWVSPLNYGAALATGNGLNARKGEEEVASWSPAWQALGRAAELYVGPKAVKGVKAAPKAVVNTATKAGVKSAKAAVVARKINKVVNGTKDLSKLLAFNLFQELTSAPTSKITRLRPEFSLAMQDKNYMFGKLLWSTNLTKDKYATSLTKHIKVMDTKRADPQIYVTQALYPLAIENRGLRATHGGLTRPIWLNSNKPYFGTPTGVSNSTNYTYVIDANKFTPELNLLRNIGETHYEYPGTVQLPIEGTKRILWDPVLLLYTSTIFTEAPKLTEPLTSLKFFERRPAKISEAERAGVPKGERNVKQGYLLKDAIEEANKFAEKWGYDKLSQNATLLDIENLYNQHNTFFRGVTTEQLENTRNRVAKELGINPELLTNDLYLLYVSTHPWPGNDRIWVTPFSHYGKIYGNSDMIGGKGLLSAVMRPWKTTKDIKQWPKLSLWTLGFKEDVSNPVITPWVSNAPDAIRSLGSLSEFLVKSPLIYRGLGKDFKGTLLLQLKYNDGQGKLGWIEQQVGNPPEEIYINFKKGGKLVLVPRK